MNAAQEPPSNPQFSPPDLRQTNPQVPYWTVRLGKLVHNVEQAEKIRETVQAALLEAEELSDMALETLHHYYSRLPKQIPAAEDTLEKANRLTAAWLRRREDRWKC